jgi:hypothetical protein
MPDTVKPVGAGGLQRLQDQLDPIAELQVGMTDNRCRRPTRTIEPGSGSSCQALDKFDLGDGTQLRGPVRAVHGPGLDENRRAHVMAAVHVGGQLMKKIALVRNALGSKIPEVVMRIADRYLGLQRRLLGQRQPIISSVGHCGSSVCFDSPLLHPIA